MNKDNIVLVSNGLKCDNELCNFEYTTIDNSDFKNFINHPCPKCGCNLLTEQDYNNFILLTMAVDTVNSMSEENIERIALNNNLEELIQLDFFKDVKNKELLKEEGVFKLTVDTHKQLKATEINKMTKGEQIIGSFNSAGKVEVEAIKTKAAELVDLIDNLGVDQRRKATAITDIEKGTMMAIKSLF